MNLWIVHLHCIGAMTYNQCTACTACIACTNRPAHCSDLSGFNYFTCDYTLVCIQLPPCLQHSQKWWGNSIKVYIDLYINVPMLIDTIFPHLKVSLKRLCMCIVYVCTWRACTCTRLVSLGDSDASSFPLKKNHLTVNLWTVKQPN